GQGVEKFDRRRARKLDVLAHAAARVEQQADMHPGRSLHGIAPGEDADGLLVSLFDDLEVLRLEVTDEIAAFVDHGHAKAHELGLGPEGRLLCDEARSSRNSRAHQHEVDGSVHTGSPATILPKPMMSGSTSTGSMPVRIRSGRPDAARSATRRRPRSAGRRIMGVWRVWFPNNQGSRRPARAADEVPCRLS